MISIRKERIARRIRTIKRTAALRGDFPISFRINRNDYVEGGLTLEETPRIATMLENEGVSVLHVSGSVHESILQKKCKMASLRPMCVRRGYFVHFAEGIKKP